MFIFKAMQIVFYVLLAYFLGAIPFSFIVAKLGRGIDVRYVDSGNVGAYNVFKNAGPFYGVVAGLLDIGKGFAPVAMARMAGFNLYEIIPVSMAVIVGHNWSLFLKFQGGQGLAPTLGVFLNISPLEILLALIAFVTGAIIAKFTSPPGWLSSRKNFGSLMGFVVYTTLIFSKSNISWGVRANYFAVLPVLFLKQIQGTTRKHAFLQGFLLPSRKKDEGKN